MRTRAARFSVALAIAGAALAGCASSTPSESAGDYPAYDEQSLVDTAALVIEGTPTATEDVVLTPRHEGGTAEENPLLGVSDEQKRQALQQDGGVPATAVTVEVTAVHRGDVEVGDEVVIVQTDGSPDERPLQQGKNYLLFAKTGVDGTFVILGGSAGMFVADGDAYRAVVSDAAPFASLTQAEAAALVK